ncbi:GatB/YqeY domain-containing protein [Yimella sp. cx-51]|uniref:GatB/YqeY domain-containing protein n=1 Tax=Yimella sp. cx-51 TaxID=2770551 RepID=UPI00165E449F|nr:GatB/YqeY domain-containing protein [Yimella sp. cx-51]MBC9956441.1 GatB/YqeY domain-containing protein [Yimella sp. cx-51]MBD2759885.1 GatB/YqeY domain-containing protein [Yimella sp. cx-573]QTH38443.1 GatB/YqeY domain-containing protein [Yimella sp. cx-51]
MTLKETLQSDLKDAMKARDQVASGTLRMTLAAIKTAEVAGDTAKELTDDEALKVVTKEAKKRREAAEAYDGAGRQELADQERAELVVLEKYLPAQLSDADLDQMVAEAVVESGATNMGGMGKVMQLLQPKIAGRADGGKVAAAVKRALS